MSREKAWLIHNRNSPCRCSYRRGGTFHLLLTLQEALTFRKRCSTPIVWTKRFQSDKSALNNWAPISGALHYSGFEDYFSPPPAGLAEPVLRLFGLLRPFAELAPFPADEADEPFVLDVPVVVTGAALDPSGLVPVTPVGPPVLVTPRPPGLSPPDCAFAMEIPETRNAATAMLAIFFMNQNLSYVLPAGETPVAMFCSRVRCRASAIRG
jgi:hypothetical protein